MEHNADRRGAVKYTIIKNNKNDKSKKKVTVGKTYATVNGCECDAVNAIERILVSNNSSIYLVPPIEYYLKASYNGESKLNVAEGDKYDEELGMGIARQRCLDKYHKDFNKVLRKFLLEMRDLLATIEYYLDKHHINYSDIPSTAEIKHKKFQKSVEYENNHSYEAEMLEE